jgi:fructose-1,6-bisphosphatase class II
MAIAESGGMLHAPDTYMLKIAAGRDCKGILDIRLSATENLKRIADVKKARVADLTAVILDRPRHKDLIEEVRAAGARIHLIGDGDVSAAIATANPDSGIDVLFGIGGAPEGVIAAAALQCLGGEFQGILQFRNEGEITRARAMGLADAKKVYQIDDLARGNLMFCATGVTDGNFLDGVRFKSWGATTHSLVMRSESGTIRHIRAEHHFDKKPRY